MSSWTLRAFSCRRTGAGLLRSGQRGAFRALYPSALFLACSAIDTGFSQPAFRKFRPIKAPYRAAGTQKWLLGTPRLRHPSVRLAKHRWQSCSEQQGSRRSPEARAGLALRPLVSPKTLSARRSRTAAVEQRQTPRRAGVRRRTTRGRRNRRARIHQQRDDSSANVGPPH